MIGINKIEKPKDNKNFLSLFLKSKQDNRMFIRQRDISNKKIFLLKRSKEF